MKLAETLDEASAIYHGEQDCSAVTKKNTKCVNKAYYTYNNNLYCGVHCRSHDRKTLPKNPNKQLDIDVSLAQHAKTVTKAAMGNRANFKKGNVICYKMKMMKDVGVVDGYLNIFPNYKHKNRADGIGLPSLSPKSIGPVYHNQPNLPVALNLENFHQGNKVFDIEVDKYNNPTKLFYDTQIKMYMDPEPHRHKLASKNKNVPLFSIWVTPDGIEHKVSYFKSRQFYCNYYERATLTNPDYIMLRNKINDGFNLRICGYDAYDVTDSVENHYLDTSRPFGHELVLYTMLVSDDVNSYPWRKYKTFDF